MDTVLEIDKIKRLLIGKKWACTPVYEYVFQVLNSSGSEFWTFGIPCSRKEANAIPEYFGVS
ncbi:hypothetical protein A3860_17075 [Niastella vici]|uniref:Uncharacterized protein n=1 Tax=Niastella vici TaxID=1703345 RepID=A0A1V9G4F3_9BACT|nr:hypothetical protein [Niastella vici]OQP65378.1 hypothetical protein A3860_17075 [Niastella vici]